MNLLELFVTIGTKGVDKVRNDIGGLSDGIKSGLGGAAKAGAAAIGAATAAAGAGVAAMGKAALDSYASYEQLAGGVEKLYGQSSDALKAYADQAYQTAGMSANEYMETATQFSSSLIKSLDGDTAKAADQTDKAMRLISDNVNVFGSNAEDVQNAIKGISRENYTMVDNLKLGYAGTKEGMKQLIADANEYAASQGKAADLQMGNFSDMIDAIQLIQEKQKIAGTTAKEAATTIEGSINMTKAAWANLLTEFGKEDGDVGKRVAELVTSAKTALLGSVDEATGEVKGGIVPRVKQIFDSIAGALPQAMPVISEAIGGVVPAVVQAFTTVLPSVLKAVTDVLAALAMELPNMVMQLVPPLLDMAPTLLETAVQVFMSIVQALTQTGPELIDKMVDTVLQLVDVMIDNLPAMLEAAGVLFMAIAQAIVQRLPDIVSKLAEVLVMLVQFVVEHAPQMLEAGMQLIGMLIQAIADSLPAVGEAILGVGQALLDGLAGVPDMLWNAGVDIVNGLIGGIQSAIGGVGQALVSGIDQGVQDFKNFLGIASPSKVMAGYGANIVQGLQMGIDSEDVGIDAAISKASASVGAAYQGGPAQLSAQSSPTIYVTVESKDDDPYETGRRIGEAAAFELKMRGVTA